MAGSTSLALLLPIMVVLLSAASVAAAPAEVGTRFPLLSDAECWRKLPPTQRGGGQPLPSWAQALAGTMPRTTAAFLHLDQVHRAGSPIDAKLRALMRWVAARANRCAYSEAYAVFDAVKAGVHSDELEALRRGDYSGMNTAWKLALEFAKKMTVDSAGVTDAEFADLVKAFDERKAAAMVLLMAYSNFQDRLLLCLGSSIEPGGPRPPIDVVFAADAVGSKMPKPLPSHVSALSKPTGKDLVEDDPDWTSQSYDQLQERLEQQRSKPTRLKIPKWEEVERGLPPGFMRPSSIVWNQISLGYVPELATAWETVMRTNMPEMRTKMDRVFGISMFWVITRSIDCPYCMGHCEMNWEVAGLPKSLIAERSQLLAGDDWSSFPAEEQRAFAFARKLTKYPGRITDEDIDTLKHDFDTERALFILTYASRCNYMTRISNGFQLRLERENVFFDYYSDSDDTAKAGAGADGKRTGR
jgi:alkylhydroperoxidase family enzyme